jgi:hypothetical protein
MVIYIAVTPVCREVVSHGPSGPCITFPLFNDWAITESREA